MTIDEAIENLENLCHGGLYRLLDGEEEAVQLGVEALKRIKLQRQYNLSYQDESLPGETNG